MQFSASAAGKYLVGSLSVLSLNSNHKKHSLEGESIRTGLSLNC